MSMDAELAKFLENATAEELRAMVRFLAAVSMEAAVLSFQYADDPAGTPARYGQ